MSDYSANDEGLPVPADEVEYVPDEPVRTVGPVTRSATAGTAVAGAVATILAWVLSLSGVEVPEAVVAAVTVVLGGLGTVVGGWLVRSGVVPADH